jgi:Arylsulfotransferase (ASST)
MIEQNTLRRRGTGLIAADPAAASPGFTLFAPLTGTGQVYLVDLNGVAVHRWDLPYRPGRHARILPGGNLAYNGTLPGGPALFPMWHKYHGGALCEVAPDGTILREHRDDLHHHDAHHFGDGRILYTAVEPLTAAAARAIPGGVPGSEAGRGPVTEGTVYADVIKETGPGGAIAWTWRAAEHLDPDRYPLQPHYRREHWPLINSVYPLADGNILASLRSVSAVIIIDRGTGKVIWHLGAGTVAQQHCASELPDGSILLFDNGTFRTAESVTYSRVIEVDRQSKAITWEYRDSPAENFFTPFMGAAQRLPNGNTLITESAFGRIFEVTRSGQVCWEYVVPYFSAYRARAAGALFPAPANAIFRAYRYTASDLPWLSG